MARCRLPKLDGPALPRKCRPESRFSGLQGGVPSARRMSAGIVHLEFDRVRSVLECKHLLPLELTVSLDLVPVEHITGQQEIHVLVERSPRPPSGKSRRSGCPQAPLAADRRGSCPWPPRDRPCCECRPDRPSAAMRSKDKDLPADRGSGPQPAWPSGSPSRECARSRSGCVRNRHEGPVPQNPGINRL